jgi:hypothetical protein
MAHKPQPTAQSFLVCREIVQDRNTGTTVIFSPFNRAVFPAFPVVLHVSLYTQLTGGRGTYKMGLRLVDSEGSIIGDVQGPDSAPLTDPVAYYQACWPGIGLEFAKPGRYDLLLTADREEIGRHALELLLKS